MNGFLGLGKAVGAVEAERECSFIECSLCTLDNDESVTLIYTDLLERIHRRTFFELLGFEEPTCETALA